MSDTPDPDVEDLSGPPPADYLAAGFFDRSGPEPQLREELRRDRALHWAQHLRSSSVPIPTVIEAVRELQALVCGPPLETIEQGELSAGDKADIERAILNQCDLYEPLERFIKTGMTAVRTIEDLGGLWKHAQAVLRYMQTIEAMGPLRQV